MSQHQWTHLREEFVFNRRIEQRLSFVNLSSERGGRPQAAFLVKFDIWYGSGKTSQFVFHWILMFLFLDPFFFEPTSLPSEHLDLSVGLCLSVVDGKRSNQSELGQSMIEFSVSTFRRTSLHFIRGSSPVSLIAQCSIEFEVLLEMKKESFDIV